MKERSAYWDNIKGVLIFLVVLTHLFLDLRTKSSLSNNIVAVVYMFHMPAFVFVSGYFGKKPIKTSGVIKLILLYFVFDTLIGVVDGSFSFIVPMYSYWYLIALLVWRTITPYVIKDKRAIILIITASLLLGFYSSFNNTLAISRIVSFYPFYISGYFLKSDNKYLQEKYRFIVGTVYLFCGCFIALLSSTVFNYSIDELTLIVPYDSPAKIFGRAMIYIVGYIMIFAFRSLAIGKNIAFITKWGKNSLWIFVIHRIVVVLIAKYYPNPKHILIFSFVVAFVMCSLLGNDFISKLLNHALSKAVELISKAITRKMRN